MNNKIVAVTLMLLIALGAVFLPLQVLAQSSTMSVYIYELKPDDASGVVGSSGSIQGSIYTSNGAYQLLFGKTVIVSGAAEGYYVNTSFTVPEVPSGTYALTLRDVAINVNYTKQFTVKTSYAINAVPSTLQEGGSLKLNVSVLGGQPSTQYGATITVKLPSSLGTTYTQTVSLGTANIKGTANAQVNYPDNSFSPDGSLTDYAGTYNIYFNQSDSSALAENTFTVNFLDLTSYHRGQTVNIKATGYQPNQAATLTVTNTKTGSTLATESVTASASGVISTSWVVPAQASIGEYTLKIVAEGTQKSIQDSQTFTVPGYAVKVQTTSLSGNPTPDIEVKALDYSSQNTYNATTNAEGTASFQLEKGPHLLTAFWNGVNVGETNVTVTGEGTFNLRCQLTDLKITVKNTQGIAMPFVDLNIKYNYQTTTIGSKTGNATGQTGPSGSYYLKSTLAGATYTVEASLYGQVFNPNNNTFANLPTQATAEIIITCPDENVTLNVIGYSGEAIPQARIELVELTNGLFYAATTDNSGTVSTQVTFGMYRARIYKNNILINETTIQAFSTAQKQIHCTLYGIEVSVSVVDFFGGAISNANVTLNGPENERFSDMTKSNGVATFSNIIGGDMQIIACALGSQDYQAITLTIDKPTTVQLKIDKFVAFGSWLIPVSSLFTVIIILIGIILLALVEIYRRRKTKPSSSETPA
ncbi:MAG: hypothetical protein NWE95_09765 [Candidatus Bathyarchaeota archaeon]|nr:hypothetical protein [Candidatus Bathyarchaeota archaeon]